MPYNPGVQDISGQLLASGMLNAAQTRGQMYGDIGQFMSNLGTSFLKQEEERQKSASAIKGFLNDPYYQQQIAQNPELTAEMGKIESGKAKLSDVRGFLGTLSTMQHMREETMKADQMETQRQYNQALREQALANKMATDAVTAERKQKNQIADRLNASIKEFQDLESIEKGGGALTSQQSDRLEFLRDNPFLTTARQGMNAGLDPMAAIQLGQKQEAMDIKAAYNDLSLQMRELEAENRRRATEDRIANQPRLVAGSTKNFKIGGKDVTGVWTGNEYVDEESGAPLYPTIEFTDRNLNKVSRRGSLNPEIASRLGIKTMAESAAMPGMAGFPGMPGMSDTGPAPEDMEEVAPPMPQFAPGEKPAAKTLAIFDNEEQARQALERGEIMPGQTITIGGRRVMLKPKTK